MFSLNDKVQVMWGADRLSISNGTIKKVTPKFVLLNQGPIRSQWVPRHLIRQAWINGESFGNANTPQYL
jgi:hypothetical protein